ncbi:MAG: crotonase/enoyl-CoA hydratase family protein [Deltaproteobacteria bacterium]|nr:crotonase/enoyl-CoA hydratase family protein [Deltaproteobacteria bacterium]
MDDTTTDGAGRVSFEVRGMVAVATLCRAAKMNAFDRAMLRSLSEAYAHFEADPALRCLLLLGEGEHFTSGLELSDVGPAVARGESLFPEGGVDPLDLANPRRRKPVVCAVQGWCITIGIELLLASDIRLAAAGTRFAQMEVQRGIMPFGGATLRMPQVAGYGNAMRWLLTGDRFDAAEALRIGLVSEVVPEAELGARALAIAERVAAQAPLAVQATRASAIAALESGPVPASRRLEGEARRLMGTADAREGLQSFVERRAAQFKGE